MKSNDFHDYERTLAKKKDWLALPLLFLIFY